VESFSSRGSRGFLQISAHEIAKSEMSQQFQVANMTNDRYAVLSAWRETLSTYIQYMKHRPGSTVVVEMAMSRRGELAAERNDESCRTEMAWVEVALKSDLTYYDDEERKYIKRMLELYRDGRLYGSMKMTEEQKGVIDPFVQEIEDKMWTCLAKQSSADLLLSFSRSSTMTSK